jgi:hypothetical protein
VTRSACRGSHEFFINASRALLDLS